MSDLSKTNPSGQEPEEQKRSGNIWGWRFSMYSLIFILLVIGVAVCRHVMLGVPFRAQEAPERQERMERDSSAGRDTLR